MDLATLNLLAPVGGIISIIISLWLFFSLKKLSVGDKKMIEIATAIQQGAMAYMRRQTKTIALFAAVLLVLFFILSAIGGNYWIGIAIAFVIGAVASATAGYIGMIVTTFANVRTAESAKHGLQAALQTSFRAGAVMGFAVLGLGLLGLSVIYYGLHAMINAGFFKTEPGMELTTLLTMVTGMGFGASLIAMFARVGGGIYTKGADVGADLVGKVESGIPEDDPRNPAVIADNVGDNVGDCAGMGADLFESYVVTLIGAMLLGNIVHGLPGIVFPMVVAGAAVFATIIGMLFVKTKEDGDPLAALNNGILATAVIAAFLFFFVSNTIFVGDLANKATGYFMASIVGLAVAIGIMYITDYYTSTKHRPVREISEAAKTGAGTNVITGIAVGLESTASFVLLICIGIFVSYYFGGIYGVAIAAMSMLSLSGIIIAVDTFGPVSDNAGGIAEMSGMESKVRKVTDKLDAVGNTTKATTKGFAIASAGLAALALMLSFANEVNISAVSNNLQEKGFPVDAAGLPIINIMNPAVLIGLFIGGMLPFIFSSYSMKAVGKAAQSIIEEVRRQFREKPGIMNGTDKPDYATCVDISTKAALAQLTMPWLLAVGTPLLTGFILGVYGVLGLLTGALVSGMALAVFMSNAGGAWDNAKKYIEMVEGGKGSDRHKAAVIGDTVGDPFKDTSGPALNPLIKILNTLAILFVLLFLKFGLNLL